jgi:DNA polymerase-3 subunit epsilon
MENVINQTEKSVVALLKAYFPAAKGVLFIDLETTGISVDHDQIIQLAYVYESFDGLIKRECNTLIRPTVAVISSAAEAVHKISMDDVAKADTFYNHAAQLIGLLNNTVVVTYNGGNFDLLMLQAEFARFRIDWPSERHVWWSLDVFQLDQILRPRNLAAVYKAWTGFELEGAHDALTDVEATKDILTAMIVKETKTHKTDPTPMLEALKHCNAGRRMDGTRVADLGGKLGYDQEGHMVYNFGKVKGTRVKDEPSFGKWVLKNDFPLQVKKLLRQELGITD